MVKRYLSFIDKIKNSSKVTLKQLLGVVQDDVRLTTGSNLRKIMMLLGKNQICELRAGGVDFTYHPVHDSDSWKIGFRDQAWNTWGSRTEVWGADDHLGLHLHRVMALFPFFFAVFYPAWVPFSLRTVFPAKIIHQSSTHKTDLNSNVNISFRINKQ